MKQFNKSVLYVAILIAFSIAVVLLLFNAKSELPVFNPSDFNSELVDVSLHNEMGDHSVSDFELRNQNGDTITQEDYDGKIYVTDFFFTRCPSICPIMSNNMEKLQSTFLDEADVMFLSVSVTPKLDSIPIIKDYAEKHGVIDGKWNITTGDKKHIYNLARKSYFAVVNEGDGGLQDFIHTPNFILIDKQKRIRGVYDGTKNEEMTRLTQDLKSLL
ncbi:SCO family protein [Maribacter algarum]|uniref:SCO family protein n=1 Tax=Maribacter algarum (ex Zhang et al. 2020) TaxID=2578118 RepID=A0A5S3PN67_9FLAO|nr:SCO family protein [Maribacter algarum]TMM55939.1 SCO family protein [Maribacter algarum]